MARPRMVRKHRPRMISISEKDLGLRIDTQPYFVPCKGLDYLNRPQRISREYLAQGTNLLVRENGILVSRDPIVPVGEVGTNIVSVVKFMSGGLFGKLLRFCQTGVQYWDGTSWTAIPGGPTLTGTATDYFSATTFDDKLIFTNGVRADGMYSYDPIAGTCVKITEGVAAQQLTTFAGRVIASDVYDPEREYQRIKWSVKYIETDWTGTGSGYEDLLSVAGGQVDKQHGVWPITDTSALVVRSRSLWQMTETGYEDAPFSFTRVKAEIGTDAPRSIANVPDGIIMLGIDNVYEIGLRGFTAIGDAVPDLFTNAVDITKCVGAYNPSTQEYVVIVDEGSVTYVYRYNLREKTWSRTTYPEEVTWVTVARPGRTFTQIDSLVGTIDAQAGIIDNLGVGGLSKVDTGLIFSTSGFVLKEDSTASSDDMGSGDVATTILAQTGVLTAASPLKKTELLEARLEYEADAAQTLIFEYTKDGGATWNTFGSNKAVTTTTGPTILRTRQEVQSHNLAVRVRAATLGKLRIHGLYLDVVQQEDVPGG